MVATDACHRHIKCGRYRNVSSLTLIQIKTGAKGGSFSLKPHDLIKAI